MRVTRRMFVGGGLAAGFAAVAQTNGSAAPAKFGPVPSLRQLRWQRMETTAFLHFTVNTFTGREWGLGDEDPSIFNPTDFDADSIVETLKAAGMKGVILTCKHHDGFCLWPTKATDHNISKSKWRDGKGDVVREISVAARKHGLKFGVYVSPWDRNNAAYGRPEYLKVYRQQITELLTNYGPVFEVWFDGANGGDGYYGGAHEKRTIDKKTYYEWDVTWALVRKLQPNAVIFSDAGPDVRWVGNENGLAPETCWATVNLEGEHGGAPAPGDVNTKLSAPGSPDGKLWVPAECDVSIRKGWFFHPEEQPKPVDTLMGIYEKSVGRGAGLLLNVPPDTRGRIADADAAVLRQFGERIQTTFARNLLAGAKIEASSNRAPRFSAAKLVDGNPDTYWSAADNVTEAVLTAHFAEDGAEINLFRMREAIALGQRVRSFSLEALLPDGGWKVLATGESIGNCRIVRLPAPIRTKQVRMRLACAAPPALQAWECFRSDVPS